MLLVAWCLLFSVWALLIAMGKGEIAFGASLGLVVISALSIVEMITK